MGQFREAYLVMAGNRRVALTKDRMTVGRTGSDCDVIIDDASVSRNHAVLQFEGGRWSVTDMGSRNKTFIDEKPVEANKPHVLADGCTLHFGFYATRFGLGAERVDEAESARTMDFSVEDAMRAAELARQEKAVRESATNAQMSAPGGEVFATLQLHSVTDPVTFNITKEWVTVGTDAQKCEVAVIDSLAAPRHAEIRFHKGNRVSIKKAGSNPIRVNNRMVNDVNLQSGDEIGLGESKFTFRVLKYPENLTVPESSSARIIRLVLLAVLIVVGLGGWYAWKVLGPGGGDEERERRREEREQITEARRYTPESILDLVTTRRYDEAIADANTMIADGISADVVSTWPQDITNLRDAAAARSRGEAGAAYQALSQIARGSEILDVAQREAIDITQRYQDWLEETRAAVQRAEGRSDWQTANSLLAELIRFHPPEQPYYEGVKRRIEIKRSAKEVYNEAVENAQDQPEEVLAEVQAEIDKVRTEGAGLPDADREFQPTLAELADAEAHAQFVIAYRNFDGDLDAVSRFADLPRAAYPERAEVDAGLDRLRRVAAIQEEIEAALSSLPRNAPPSRQIFAQMDALAVLYNRLLDIEDSRDFSLASEAASGIEQINSVKREEIFKRSSAQITVDESLRGDALIMQRALAERRKWFRILELYPQEAVLSEGSDDDLRMIITDADLFDEFRNARQEYNGTLSTISSVLLSAAANRDEAVTSRRGDIFRQLEETTLSYDSFGLSRVENLRERLNQMLGPE